MVVLLKNSRSISTRKGDNGIMKKSIKRAVGIRVAAAMLSLLVFCGVVAFGIGGIKKADVKSADAQTIFDQARAAEVAHYKWSGDLSSALYEDTQFTGSVDASSCALGKWIYGDPGSDDATLLQLRNELEPIHKNLHESAIQALNMLKVDPKAAQEYYNVTIKKEVENVVAKLNEVNARADELRIEGFEQKNHTIKTIQLVVVICFVLSLLSLLSLVLYVINNIVRPILSITKESAPLYEGHLHLEFSRYEDNEIGKLAAVLDGSLKRVDGYVSDINRIMTEMARGNFAVDVSEAYIGDFSTIETSIKETTDSLSQTISQINQATMQVTNGAEQISNNSQALAQGATEQATAVEELLASLDELSKNAESNSSAAESMQENARQTNEQISTSNEQMAQMVGAMEDIRDSSHEIGKIIATIENIAFQTNILALNAAVEAARVGAAGKGFAVVADEVRSLAGQSDQAAKATRVMIETSMEAVERGGNIVEAVSQTMQKTLELAAQSNEEINGIAAVVREEAESIAQVTEGIDQISQVVQTNSATSQEVAAVSEELFSQAQVLRDQTEVFKVKM